MDMLKKYFPLSFKAKDLQGTIINCIICLVAGFVVSFVCDLLAKIPLIGFVFNLVSGLVGLYLLITIVLAILNHLKLLK